MKIFAITAGLLATFAVTTALGDTLPPWARGASGTTYDVWNFVSSGILNVPPDVLGNPYGTPGATIDYNPPFGTGWYANNSAGSYTNSAGDDTGATISDFGSVPYFWDIARGSMLFTIPTAPANGLAETNQIQVTYFVDINLAPTVSVTGGTQLGSTIITDTGIGGVNGGEWFTALSTWLIQPGTSSDIITILGNQTRGSVIDQVIVDTLTVPEPPTISFAVLGAAALVGAAVRRRKSSR